MAKKDQVVVVHKGGVSAVFWGLVLFFIVLPVVSVLGCFACSAAFVGTAINEAAKRQPVASSPPTGSSTDTAPETDRDADGPAEEPQAGTAEEESADTNEPEKPARPSPAARVAAAQLLNEYEANEVAADNRYKGKLIGVSGIVDRVGKDILDSPYVALRGDNEYGIFIVQCFFKSESTVSDLSPGDHVQLVGRCDGKFGNVLLRDCGNDDELYELQAANTPEAKAAKARGDQLAKNKARMEAAAKAKANEEVRTWISGTHKTEATFQGFAQGKVKLRKTDGKEISVPLEKLSEEDQAFVKSRGR